jgi:hypothetical protein
VAVWVEAKMKIIRKPDEKPVCEIAALMVIGFQKVNEPTHSL